MPDNVLTLNIYGEDKGKFRLRFISRKGKFGCVLPLDQDGLKEISESVNKLLEQIINDNSEQYEHKISIPKSICHKDLDRIGTELNLFDRFFFEAGKRDDLNAVRAYKELKSRSQQLPLTIQIVADSKFVFPWALMYDGDHLARNLPANSFWGFKHIIQHMPDESFEQEEIIKTNNLELGFNISKIIDERFPDADWVQQHERFARYIKNACTIHFNERTKEEEVLNAFARELPESIIYFFCHALYSPLGKKPAYDSYIKLTTYEKRLTLGTLYWSAETSDTFSKEPLVFVNACQSASLSPLFYEGFVPYLLLKGARGIVGTISSIPGVFASRFGLEFLTRLFMGYEVDRIISHLRQEFLLQNNILGLYYVSFCNFDLKMDQPLIYQNTCLNKDS